MRCGTEIGRKIPIVSRCSERETTEKRGQCQITQNLTRGSRCTHTEPQLAHSRTYGLTFLPRTSSSLASLACDPRNNYYAIGAFSDQKIPLTLTFHRMLNIDSEKKLFLFLAGFPTGEREHRELDPERQVAMPETRPLRLGALPPEGVLRLQAHL